MSETVVRTSLPVVVSGEEFWYTSWVDDNGSVPVLWLWVSINLYADGLTLKPLVDWLGAFSCEAEHVRFQEDPGYMGGEVAVVKVNLYPPDFFPFLDTVTQLQTAIDGGERSYASFDDGERDPIPDPRVGSLD